MAAHGVAVHAGDASVWEHLLQTFFALLGADAEEVDMLAFAFGAMFRDGAAEAAVVALHALMDGAAGIVSGCRFVMRERDGAIFALELFAAGAAHDDEGIAAAIQEQHGLFAAAEGRFDFFDEGAGEQVILAGLGEFLAHVDERNFWERPLADALLDSEQGIFSALGVRP